MTITVNNFHVITHSLLVLGLFSPIENRSRVDGEAFVRARPCVISYTTCKFGRACMFNGLSMPYVEHTLITQLVGEPPGFPVHRLSRYIQTSTKLKGKLARGVTSAIAGTHDAGLCVWTTYKSYKVREPVLSAQCAHNVITYAVLL